MLILVPSSNPYSLTTPPSPRGLAYFILNKLKKHGKKHVYTRRLVFASRRRWLVLVGRGGGEAGGDGGVVHGVVEALRLHHPQPQLPRLVLRQHAEPPRGALVLRRRLLLRRRRGRLRVDVVGLAGPPQQRRPPLGAPAVGGRRRRPSRTAVPSAQSFLSFPLGFGFDVNCGRVGT